MCSLDITPRQSQFHFPSDSTEIPELKSSPLPICVWSGAFQALVTVGFVTLEVLGDCHHLLPWGATRATPQLWDQVFWCHPALTQLLGLIYGQDTTSKVNNAWGPSPPSPVRGSRWREPGFPGVPDDDGSPRGVMALSQALTCLVWWAKRAQTIGSSALNTRTEASPVLLCK